jgi:hypothetical protein
LTKQCSHCKETKPHDAFNNDCSQRDGKCSWCRDCCSKAYNKNKVARVKTARSWYLNNKERVCERARQRHKANYPSEKDSRLDKRFGSGASQHRQNKFNEQGGECAICGKREVDCSKALALDHNHITGKWRGLLCDLCNTAIGKLHDDVNVLQKAIDYLRKYDDVP